MFLFSFSAFAAEDETKQVMIELEAITEDKDYFCPNEQAEYTLTLKNKLGSSWIRVKFELSSKSINQPFTENHLQIQDGWEKHGDYFYYTKKADAYQDYPVVKGIQIPDATAVEHHASITIAVYGEAIPYDAVIPDFSSEKPWDRGTGTNSLPGIYQTQITGSSHQGFSDKNSIYLYSSPQETGTFSTGIWELVDEKNHNWKYHDCNGYYAKNGWIYVENPYSPNKKNANWFHFNEEGIMTFGWYRANEKAWYYCHEISDGNLGMLIRGWYKDIQDGNIYFLDQKTGIMLSGWQEINGKHYYFTTLEEVPRQTWFWQTLENTELGRWIYERLGYRSYGSMYVNETVPDGQKVNQEGIRE